MNYFDHLAYCQPQFCMVQSGSQVGRCLCAIHTGTVHWGIRFELRRGEMSVSYPCQHRARNYRTHTQLCHMQTWPLPRPDDWPVTLNAEIVTRYRVLHKALLLHPYAPQKDATWTQRRHTVWQTDTDTAPVVCKHRSDGAHDTRSALTEACRNTERTGASGNVSDVYSGGTYFESRPDYPCCVSSWRYLTSGQGHSLSHAFQFIFIKRSWYPTLYKLSSCHSR
jgi:hypothetical protein